MKQFVQLYRSLDQTNSSIKKVQALVNYFDIADEKDALWTIALFSHRRPKRTVNTKVLREWAAELAGIPLWLFEDSYHIVGDLAETISLCLPAPKKQDDKNLCYWIDYVRSLKDLSEEEKKSKITSAWDSLESDARYLLNKFITGGFRVGVSQKTIVKALAKKYGLDEAVVSHKLMGNWSPDTHDLQSLLFDTSMADMDAKPFPFSLAYPLDQEVEDLGSLDSLLFEYKWDGIRGQLIKRNNEWYLWSRGEELITDRFPEFKSVLDINTDNFVLDGEIIIRKDGLIKDFQELQTRIGRKNVSKKKLQDSPAAFIAYDIMEFEGQDIRHLSQDERRKKLAPLITLLPNQQFSLSAEIKTSSWDDIKKLREEARSKKAEGVMIKQRSSPYQTGRKKGHWWKWKLDPYTIDAVMLYAQRGHGRRANLFSDFTFAVWDEGSLIPFAKAYSGLTDAEFKQITQWVNKNTIERFGPVRSVPAFHVFEIAFEGISLSKRHKSGVALRFPRIKRWRHDKQAKEANTLADLKKLL